MNENEISENEEKEKNMCCDNCNSNFHYGCQSFISTSTLLYWLCLVYVTDLPGGTK